MKLNGIDDAELKALCEQIVAEEEAPAERVRDSKSSSGPRRRPLLRVVK
jgi:hypothetical protein